MLRFESARPAIIKRFFTYILKIRDGVDGMKSDLSQYLRKASLTVITESAEVRIGDRYRVYAILSPDITEIVVFMLYDGVYDFDEIRAEFVYNTPTSPWFSRIQCGEIRGIKPCREIQTQTRVVREYPSAYAGLDQIFQV